jgi:hypothetical protein
MRRDVVVCLAVCDRMRDVLASLPGGRSTDVMRTFSMPPKFTPRRHRNAR